MAIKRVYRDMLILLALIVSLDELSASAESDLRAELEGIVAAFNERAQTLNADDIESVRSLNAFIDQVLSVHWDTEHMAIHLLEDAKYQSLSYEQQHQTRQSLETTFYRYIYEIIEEYGNSPLVLVDDVYQDKKGRLRIKIRGNPRLLPALTGDLYLDKSANGWVIIDVGYAGFTYISLKRRAYQRKLTRAGVDGLTAWLDKKNRLFFADYCSPELDLIMPAQLSALCEEA
jgi:ABC-type transporter MlaC component